MMSSYPNNPARPVEIREADLAAFSRRLEEEERAKNTVDKYLRDLRAFVAFLRARGGEAAADRRAVLDYKAELERRYAPSSANSMIAAINSFFRFLDHPELCVRRLRIQRQVFCKEERELTRVEYLRLVEAAERGKNVRLAMLLQTICGTGIRVSELRFITCEAVRLGRAVVRCKSKTRTVFLVRDLQKKLREYCRREGIRHGCVFVTASGKPLDRSNIWREMKALCRAARVDPRKVFPHNLRHLFARSFYALEKDLAKLSDILGHSSINTTRVYILSTGREHRSEMEKMRLIL